MPRGAGALSRVITLRDKDHSIWAKTLFLRNSTLSKTGSQAIQNKDLREKLYI